MGTTIDGDYSDDSPLTRESAGAETDNHSRNFDQRSRPAALRTAIAIALRLPTSTTKRFPRVMPV